MNPLPTVWPDGLIVALVVAALLVSDVGTAAASRSKAVPAPAGVDMSGLPAEVRRGIQHGDARRRRHCADDA